MKMTTSLACALFAFACTAAAGAQDGGTNASARNAVSGGKVVLLPFGRPGPGGSAALAQQGANVVVTLTLPNMQGTVMAALLQGSCTTGAPQVNNVGQALKAPINGISQTILPNTTIAKLASSPHAIVVRGNSTTLCGDLSTLLAPQKP